MAVVPGDELRRGVAALQILAGDAHAPIGLRAGRIDDHVIVRAQVVHAQVTAELDGAEESKSRVRRDLVERRRHRFDLLMVGRDAGADQAIRRRHAVVHVHVHHEARLSEQLVRGVEARGPGADDGHAQRLRLGAGSCHRPAGFPCSSVSSICRVSTSPR